MENLIKTLTEQLKERLPDLEAAFTETGRPKVDFSVYPEDKRAYKEACYQAETLFEAARKIELENSSEEIDWENNNQWKWQPWFWMSPSGFAFGVSYCTYSLAYAGSGSRLRLLTEEASNYIGRTEAFLQMWKIVQLG